MTAAAGVAKQLKHEELFVERYSRLLKWAFQLTKPDGELAKDLVQDAFIQFTGASNDLISINNIDNYLFGVVRNTYLSHRRRNSRQLQEQLADAESHSSQTLLLSVDPRRQIQISDELRAICHHVCARKDTSISSSILILRYFHGYVPSELARLIHSSRNIVDVQLRFARAEAIASLNKPKSLNRDTKRESSRRESRNQMQIASDLLTELRDHIFAKRRGQCLDSPQLSKLYKTHKVMPRATLSHLVSCQRCLDQANSLLGLPLVHERNVIDVLGRTSDAESGTVHPFMKFIISFVGVWPLLVYLNFGGLELFGCLT